VRIDFLARERHFADHLAPVARALRARGIEGRFIVEPAIAWRAVELGFTPDQGASDPSVPIVLASYGDLKVARKAGRTKIALLQHGIGQSYGGDARVAEGPSYSGGRDNGDVGLFLCPNEHSANRWREAYPAARVEIVGCPKLDTLPAREPGPGPVIAFTFHWDAHVVNETRSGFRQFSSAIVAAKRQGWTVLGHGRPRLLTDYRTGAVRFYARFGIECTTDFDEVCRRADLLVFDNTSSGYEFAATGRPVLVLDPIQYRPLVTHGLRFWEAADVGVRVKRREQVVSGIIEALADAPERQAAREAALSIVYGYRTGASERAADVIVDWASRIIHPRIACGGLGDGGARHPRGAQGQARHRGRGPDA